MTTIQTIKATISVKDAAEYYGIQTLRPGSQIALCPFHDDHDPSLMLYHDHYYCFGCGAHGDVINFTAALFNLSNREAMEKLLYDFHLAEGETERRTPMTTAVQQFRDREHLCLAALSDHLWRLRTWKTKYAPKSPDEPIDHRYKAACFQEPFYEYFLDVFRSGSREEKKALMDELFTDDAIPRLKHKGVLKEQEEDRNE